MASWQVLADNWNSYTPRQQDDILWYAARDGEDTLNYFLNLRELQTAAEQKADEDKANSTQNAIVIPAATGVGTAVATGVGQGWGQSLASSKPVVDTGANALAQGGSGAGVGGASGSGVSSAATTAPNINSQLAYNTPLNTYSDAPSGLGVSGGGSATTGGGAVTTESPVFSTAADGAGFANLGLSVPTLGLGAAAVGGTIAGRDAAHRYGGDDGSNAWAGANATNPINEALEVGGNYNRVMNGEKIDDSTALALAVPTAGLSLLYNPLFSSGRGLFGSSKGKDQVARDSVRSNMKGSGLIDNDYNLTLKTGQTVDMGLDGGAKQKDSNLHVYDIDWDKVNSDGRYGDLIAALDPLSVAYGAGDEKLRSGVTGQLFNAVNEGGLDNAKTNVLDLYDRAGGKDSVINAIRNSDYSDEEKNIFINSINDLYRDSSTKNAGKGLLSFSNSDSAATTNKQSNLVPISGDATLTSKTKNNVPKGLLALGLKSLT